LEEDGAVAFGDAAFAPLPFVAAGVDRVGVPLLTGRFAVRDDLRAVFADFDLLVAIRLSSGVNDSIMCCH
jgi:hypothetical protein